MRNHLILLSLLCAIGCTSTALPPEHCTPGKQSAFLANCALVVELECERTPDACPSPNACQDVLEDLCPAGR